VESGGSGVVAHVGLHTLGAFADRLGLGDALSACLPWGGSGMAIHDRGKVLVQLALVLAGGGESCLDIKYLRSGDQLFGAVPSDTTVSRAIHEITPQRRDALIGALAEVRAQIWSRSSATTGKAPVILDIDASLVDVHSENKEMAAPTFKGFLPPHVARVLPLLGALAVAGVALQGRLGAHQGLGEGLQHGPGQVRVAVGDFEVLAQPG
jgi:hypothetical protein